MAAPTIRSPAFAEHRSQSRQRAPTRAGREAGLAVAVVETSDQSTDFLPADYGIRLRANLGLDHLHVRMYAVQVRQAGRIDPPLEGSGGDLDQWAPAA